jgi:hypothetical protein
LLQGWPDGATRASADQPRRSFDVRFDDYCPDEDRYEALTAARAATIKSHRTVSVNDPQTLAFALNDSPVGLLAWLIERRYNWSDVHGMLETAFTKDFLLTTTSIYWFTKSIGTSMRYYAEYRDFERQFTHGRQ